MDVGKILESRKRKVNEMANEGFSYYDIARYFEVSPRIMRDMMKDMGLKPIDKTKGSEAGKIVELMQLRNDEFQKKKRDVFNEECGFLCFRNTLKKRPKIKNPYSCEYKNKEYTELFHEGYKKGRHESQGEREIRKRGDDFRRFNRDIGIFLELYLDGWSGPEISRYAGIEKPKSLLLQIKENVKDLKRRAPDKYVLEVFRAGYTSKEAAFLTGIETAGSSKEKRDNLPKFRSKNKLARTNPDRPPSFTKKYDSRTLSKIYNDFIIEKPRMEICAEYSIPKREMLYRLIQYCRKVYGPDKK